MFFSASQIADSISSLAEVHQFHGITFLACKEGNLPIGQTTTFAIDAKTHHFLEKHHRIAPDSSRYFQPFGKQTNWVRNDYAASGLQAINTQTFSKAFIHDRNTQIWAWDPKYVNVLASLLNKGRKIPAFQLAVWLYKEKDWPKRTSHRDVVDYFLDNFRITDAEKVALFDVAIPQALSLKQSFQEERVGWTDLRQFLPPPPDARPDQGGTLALLKINGLGPAEKMELAPSSRLTLITGDNGLGKTFLLECAWWALTGNWAGRPAYPGPGQKTKASISFWIEGEKSGPTKTEILFDWNNLSWPRPKKRPTIPGLTIYARVDGSFAVWDPAKPGATADDTTGSPTNVFTNDEVWDGLPGRIEGLVRDWVRWQSNPAKYPFETFQKVLKQLSPPDLGALEPGEPVRIPDDPRDIPTIKHPYGTTPILYSSAGVRRIITLAYLVVWAWNEHKIAADLTRKKPQRRMVVLIDEMEAHLHPRWQRAVLPALMSIGEMLSEKLEVQFIVATHSPLVMASSETIFDSDRDTLYHLDLDEKGIANLKEIDFVRFGDVSSWLTSPVFELKHARSGEAERAIEAAKKLQLRKEVSREEVREVTSILIKCLAADDKFWPRWIGFAEKHGVDL